MTKPVITFVFKVLRNGLFRYIFYTLHMPKPVITFVFKVLRMIRCGEVGHDPRNLWNLLRTTTGCTQHRSEKSGGDSARFFQN